jgi:translation initiation factor 4G
MFPQRFANSAARPVMHQPPLLQKPRPPLRPPTSSHNGGVISSDASRGLPPGLDHKEPLPLRYANRSTGGKKSIGKPQIPPDENEKAVESIINKYLRSHNVETAINAVQSLQTISIITVCILLMSKTLEKSEDDRTRMSDLLSELHSQNIISSSDFTKAFDTVMTSSTNREADVPQCKTYMAGYAARAIAKGVVTLREVATMFDQGAHHPTMLVILQALLALIGEEKLYNMFTESKLTVTSILPVELQSHESITEITEAKKLGFLYPLKKIQTELDTMLNSGASTSCVYKWIEGNVDSSLHCNPDFIMIITRLILVHATSDTSLARDVNRSLIPSPDIISREKTLVAKYTMLMQRFVSDNIPLQIAVLYTTQMFCDDHNFPKGLVLRLFSYWYEMDVVDGVSLLQWRDDTSQNYPGKGKALFQVNHWLKLVEEAEELSSSDED